MKWHLGLPYATPPLTLNDRKHWADEHRWKKQIRNDVTILARAHRLPKDLDRIHVQLHWQPKVKRTRDTDNPTPTLKPCIDGLVSALVVKDDDYTHVTSEVVIHPAKAGTDSTPRLWLVITDGGSDATSMGAA